MKSADQPVNERLLTNLQPAAVPIRPRRLPWLTLAVAALIGTVVFERAIGFGVVDHSNLDWLIRGGIDPSGHFFGWHMFRFDDWHVPPGAIQSFGHPIGTSIALTDSIPLVAFPLKAVSSILPAVFQYMGLWLLACFALQAVFGALLVGTATDRRPLQLLGAAFFALSPVLTNRIGHQGLCAHWLLLAALWLHFRDVDGRGARSTMVWWVVLVAIVAATHPYLALGVLAVAAASVLQDCDRALRVPAGLARVAVLLATTGAVWWLSGYFVVGQASDLQDGGFGRLSLNLLGPVIPQPGALLSRQIPFANAWPDQREGFSYLGLGGIGLVLVALPLVRPSRTALRSPRPWLFLAACVGLTAFALSPTITLGTRVLAEYDPAWWGPLSAFRSSGRIFWIVYYAILFGAMATVVRRLPYRWALGVVAAATVVQALDMREPLRMSRFERDGPVTYPLQSAFWNEVPRHYRHLVLNPTNMCVGPGQGLDYRFFALVAGPAGATLNGGYAGRYDVRRLQTYCQTLAEELRSGLVSDDTLYVTSVDLAAALRQSAQQPLTCTTVDGLGVCFTSASHDRWRSRFDVGSGSP